MSITKNGTVDKIARSGKAFTLIEDGGDLWYSAFSPSQCNGVTKGSTVEFQFLESNKGGVTYNNIKGSVKVTGGAVVLPPSCQVYGGSPEPSAVFGSMLLSKDRSIARQNACNVAKELVGFIFDEGSMRQEEIMKIFFEVAKQIEAYTTGDSDKKEAEEVLTASTALFDEG